MMPCGQKIFVHKCIICRYEKGLCPNAEAYYETSMSLPLYYGLTDEDVDSVIHAVNKIIAYYRK